MAEPTFDDIEALVGPATPHFAFQLRARVRELIAGLPEDDPVRRFGEEKIRAARRPRPRLVEGRGRRARGAADADRLGRDPVVGAGGPAPAAHGLSGRSALMGRSVLVTGGSRGIGKAIALRFAREGATRVAIGYMRSDAAAEETAAELRALGAEPVLVRGNVTSERVLEQVGELGPLDVFVHNAATGVIRPALETEEKHWDWTLNANARSFLALTRVIAPAMPAGSSVVAISSLGSIRVLENYALVGTSKAALESLVRYLAVELGPAGIRVERGLGRRRRHRRARPLPEPRGDAADGRRNAAGRLVTPEDMAGAVAFLSSPEAEMVRGQTLIVDGGFSLVA